MIIDYFNLQLTINFVCVRERVNDTHGFAIEFEGILVSWNWHRVVCFKNLLIVFTLKGKLPCQKSEAIIFCFAVSG